MLHCMGLSNEEIAKRVGLSGGRYVGAVLADPRAQRVVEKIREKLLGSTLITVREKMIMGADGAVENILNTVNAKDIPQRSRFKRHQDAVSFELLKRLGFDGREDGEGKQGGIRLSPEMEERLVRAIEQANEAREIFQEEIEDVDAQPAIADDSSSSDSQ